MAHVVVDVEMGVVDPHRTAQLEGHVADHAAVTGYQRQFALDHRLELHEGGLRALEDAHRGDVHVADAVLDVEEGRVQWAHPVDPHGDHLLHHHQPPVDRRLLPGATRLHGPRLGQKVVEAVAGARSGAKRPLPIRWTVSR